MRNQNGDEIAVTVWPFCLRCSRMVKICIPNRSAFFRGMEIQDMEGQHLAIATLCKKCERAMASTGMHTDQILSDVNELCLSANVVEGSKILTDIHILVDGGVELLKHFTTNGVWVEPIEGIMKYVDEDDRIYGIDPGCLDVLPYLPGGFIH